VILHVMLDGRDEDERDMFMQELYDDGTADETALEALRKHMGWEDGDGTKVQDQPG
jgi:hypothetical protein